MRPEELWAVWVTAGATILAAVVPGVLFLYERKDRKAAENALSDDRTAAVERERTTRARAILGSAIIYTEVNDEHSDDRQITGWRVTAKVTNLGTNPVFTVYVFAQLTTKPTIIGIWQHLPPGADSRGPELPIRRMPGEEVPDRGINLPLIWVEFTDVDGERWRRYVDGKVEPGQPPPFPVLL